MKAENFNFIEFYKSFAEGNQKVRLDVSPVITDKITYQCSLTPIEPDYYWQEFKTYNIIDIEIGRNLTAIKDSICNSDPTQYQKTLQELIYGHNGLVAHLMPIQLDYNKAMNEYSTALTFVTKTRLVVEDGSVDTEALQENGVGPGKLIVYRQGATPPAAQEQNLAVLDVLKKHTEYLRDLLVETAAEFVSNLEEN